MSTFIKDIMDFEFSADEWEILKYVQELSVPITITTELLSGSTYPTLSLVIPIILATDSCLVDVVVPANISKLVFFKVCILLLLFFIFYSFFLYYFIIYIRINYYLPLLIGLEFSQFLIIYHALLIHVLRI